MAYQSATVFGFSAVAGRTKRFPPTSLLLQENVVWILRHQQRDGPAWSQSNTRDLSTAVLEGVWGTSGESVLHSLVESCPPIMVACLTECDHVRRPVEKALTALVLAPLGVQILTGAELRLVSCEKYTTGVRLDIFFELPVLSCFSSSFRLSHLLAGAWNSLRFKCVGVWTPGSALGFQRFHFDGSFQGSSQSKGKSSDRGQTFEGK